MKELIVLTLLFIASIQCSAIKNEQTHHHHGKDKDGHHHLGFVGSRGKRSVNTLDPSLMMEEPVSSDNVNERAEEWPALTQSFYDFQRNIRAPKGFFGMRGKKDFTNAEKRALMGIQQNLNGLRGRTRFIEQQNIDENLIEQQPVNSNQGYFSGVRGGEGMKYVGDYGMSGGNSLGEKRAPKGFLGMRGKKSYDEQSDDDFENNFYAQKRVPSGFTGVRGKKDSSMLQ